MEKKKEGDMMNEVRERFSFFRTYVETIEKCPERVQLALFKAVVHYGLDEEMPDFSQFGEESCYLDAIFCQQLVSLDYSHMKQEVGKNGGAPLGNKHNPYGRNGKPINNQEPTNKQPINNQEPTNKQPINNQEPTNKQPINNQEPTHDNDNDYDNDIKEESTKKKPTAFVPPTLSEVSDYISEKGYKIDAEAFVSYYSSIGWMIGRNKMKDWRMALVTWMKRDNTSRDTRHNTQPQRSMKPIKAEDVL